MHWWCPSPDYGSCGVTQSPFQWRLSLLCPKWHQVKLNLGRPLPHYWLCDMVYIKDKPRSPPHFSSWALNTFAPTPYLPRISFKWLWPGADLQPGKSPNYYGPLWPLELRNLKMHGPGWWTSLEKHLPHSRRTQWECKGRLCLQKCTRSRPLNLL